MMVLPVPGGGSKPGDGKKKGKKGQKDGVQDVQVNLIVDPNMFRAERSPSASEEEDDESDPWSANQHQRPRRKRHPRRRGVFEGLALEESWRVARRELKRSLAIDIVLLVAWLAAFIYVLMGKRCPANTYDGW
jgi:hypothetical protein